MARWEHTGDVDEFKGIVEGGKSLCCCQWVFDCDLLIFSDSCQHGHMMGECLDAYSVEETEVMEIPWAQTHPSAPFNCSKISGG